MVKEVEVKQYQCQHCNRIYERQSQAEACEQAYQAYHKPYPEWQWYEIKANSTGRTKWILARRVSRYESQRSCRDSMVKLYDLESSFYYDVVNDWEVVQHLTIIDGYKQHGCLPKEFKIDDIPFRILKQIHDVCEEEFDKQTEVTSRLSHDVLVERCLRLQMPHLFMFSDLGLELSFMSPGLGE